MGSAVPFRVSLLISIPSRLNLVLTGFLPSSAAASKVATRDYPLVRCHVVVVVVVFTLKAVPISTQYFLTSVLVQLTRTPSVITGYTYQKEIEGPRKVNTRDNWKNKIKPPRKLRLQTVRCRRRHVRQRRYRYSPSLPLDTRGQAK